MSIKGDIGRKAVTSASSIKDNYAAFWHQTKTFFSLSASSSIKKQAEKERERNDFFLGEKWDFSSPFLLSFFLSSELRLQCDIICLFPEQMEDIFLRGSHFLSQHLSRMHNSPTTTAAAALEMEESNTGVAADAVNVAPASAAAAEEEGEILTLPALNQTR